MSALSFLRDSGNTLLDQLPDDEFDPLVPMLQRVNLSLRQVIHQFDADVTHVYFPTTSLISLMTVLEEDDPVESATVGREGFVGISVSLGVDASPHRALCQMGGDSFRLPIHVFREAIGRSPRLSRLIQRYIAFMLRTTGQGIACNALHDIEARASRWLLTIHDQSGRDEFPMTQEFLAYMLGVRRQTVTVVAGTLHSAGLITARRGAISIRDRAGLEDAACECYATLRGYYGRIVS